MYLRRNDLIYPELSYRILGCAYEVFNELGPGHREVIYQRALAASFNKAGIEFKEQARGDVFFQGAKIASGVLDFLVEEKIVVEIKSTQFIPAAFKQVQQYLQLKQLELGILISFATNKVISRRVLNIRNSENSQAG